MLLAMITFLVVASGATAGRGAHAGPVHHTCSATDKQFLQVAELDITSLGAWSEDYLHGDAKAGEVIGEAQAAAARVGATSPSDPSLAQTRKLLGAMFIEYAKAIQAKSKSKDDAAGRYIFHAYGLANLAHDVLVQAKPALQPRGCDLSSLL